MADPLLRYFGAVDNTIAGCDWTVTSIPELKITFDRFNQWKEILWQFKASFPAGQRLIASESHYRDKGQHYRKIKYRLMSESGELIFQVDTHSSAIPFEKCPHLHIGPTEDQIVQEGDPQLIGHSLQNFDFMKMWKLVQDYLEDERLPWQ